MKRFGLLFYAFSLFFATLTLTARAADFSVSHFKHQLDQDNLAFVMRWLQNDLRSSPSPELRPLAERLKHRQQSLLQHLSQTPEAINYEAYLLQGLLNPEETALSEPLRQLIRHSVSYLNFSEDPRVQSLLPYTPRPQRALSYQTSQGYPAFNTAVTASSAHTIINLQSYIERRLGKVPLTQLSVNHWPLHIFNTAADPALNHLKTKGYTHFFKVNNFYSQWGKAIFLAQKHDSNTTSDSNANDNYALVYTDLFGDFLAQHTLYMLNASNIEGRTVQATQITRYANTAHSTKAQYLAAYRRDLARIPNPSDTVLMLGYYELIQKELQRKQVAQQLYQSLQAQLDATELAYQERMTQSPEAFAQMQAPLAPWRFSEHHQQALTSHLQALLSSCAKCPLQQRLTKGAQRPPRIHQQIDGEVLKMHLFQLQDQQQKPWQMLNIGADHSLYGDMSAELVHIALQTGFRHFVFSGSSGAVNVDYPIYALLLPKTLQDYQGEAIAYHNPLLQTDRQGEKQSYAVHHQGVISPVAETQAVIQTMMKNGVDALDVEAAEIAKIVSQYPEASLSLGLIVTDYPGAFLKQGDFHLDRMDYAQKYKMLPTLLNLLFQHYHIQKIHTQEPAPHETL